MEKLAEVKQCTKCKEVEPTTNFYKNGTSPDGLDIYCKSCRKLIQAESVKRNADKMLSKRHNERAKKLGLPAELTPSLVTYMKEEQQGRCILSGLEENLHFEHAVPLSKGGGSTFENCYFISDYFNATMHDKNMFEWVKGQLNFVQRRFYNVFVPMMAERNGMTPKEYEAFVYSQYHENEKGIV